jgi:hypothetical protein
MQNDLQDTLNCAFAEVGSQVGELIRCMIVIFDALHNSIVFYQVIRARQLLS